jgi:hypothetical protein
MHWSPANKDMRQPECQKIWRVIESSSGHSAAYAWCYADAALRKPTTCEAEAFDRTGLAHRTHESYRLHSALTALGRDCAGLAELADAANFQFAELTLVGVRVPRPPLPRREYVSLRGFFFGPIRGVR